MRTIRLTGFGIVLFCFFLSNSIAAGQAAAQNQPIQSRKGYCKAWSSDQAKIYFSDVFEVNVTPNVIVTRGIENLFEAYLKQSYGYNSTPITPVVCQYMQSVAAAEENKKQEQAQFTTMGKQLVVTRWKPSPQQAAALVALPTTPPCYEHDANNPDCQQTGSPAAPKPTLYEVCRAVTSVQTGGKRTTYFSGIMPRANINDADYSAGFAAFLAKKYGVQYVTPECGNTPSQAEGQKLMETGWWKVNPYNTTAVQTGWTYSPASPPSSPAPATSASAAPASTAAPARPAQNVSAAPVTSTHATTATPQSAPSKPSPPSSSYAYCYSTDGAHTAYFSAPFKVADGDSTKWRQAFAVFLQKKYHAGAPPGCYRHSSLADAHSDLKKLQGAFPPTSKIVETGWEYK